MEIEKFIDLPKPARPGAGKRRSKYPFAQLQPGQMLRCSDKQEYERAKAAARSWAEKHASKGTTLVPRMYFDADNRISYGIFCVSTEESDHNE